MRYVASILLFLFSLTATAEWSLDDADPSSPVEDPDVLELVRSSIDWYREVSGLTAALSMPEVRHTTSEHMAFLYKQITGIDVGERKIEALYWHDPPTFIVYYLPELDLTELKDRSKVAHESFHYVQFMNRMHERVRCGGVLESDAHTHQAMWYAAQGGQDHGFISQRRMTARAYRCR